MSPTAAVFFWSLKGILFLNANDPGKGQIIGLSTLADILAEISWQPAGSKNS